MADFQWGVPTAWADAVAAASFQTLANNSIAVGAVIDNTTTRDMMAEVSFISAATTSATTAGAHLAVYLLPLLHNGTAYPTNNTTGSALPAVSYVRGVIGIPVGTVTPAGSTIIQVPYGSWKFGIANRLGVALANSTTNYTCQYRLLLESVA